MTGLPRENVQSFPRPPALEPVPQRIAIRLGGVIVAVSCCRWCGRVTGSTF